jgi:hypothetical protein
MRALIARSLSTQSKEHFHAWQAVGVKPDESALRQVAPAPHP